MAKAYWVATYRAIKDPAAMAEYAKVSRPALEGRLEAEYWRAECQ